MADVWVSDEGKGEDGGAVRSFSAPGPPVEGSSEDRIAGRSRQQHPRPELGIGAVLIETGSQCIELQGSQLAQPIEQVEHGARALAKAEIGIVGHPLRQRQGVALEPLAAQPGGLAGIEETLVIGEGLAFERRRAEFGTVPLGLGARDLALAGVMDEQRYQPLPAGRA